MIKINLFSPVYSNRTLSQWESFAKSGTLCVVQSKSNLILPTKPSHYPRCHLLHQTQTSHTNSSILICSKPITSGKWVNHPKIHWTTTISGSPTMAPTTTPMNPLWECTFQRTISNHSHHQIQVLTLIPLLPVTSWKWNTWASSKS